MRELRGPLGSVAWSWNPGDFRCVLGGAENSGTRVRAGLTQIPPFPGCSLSYCASLGRMQSLSPGACPWAVMWGLTASLTSWSASQSARASASTFSVWVSSGLARGRRWCSLCWPPIKLGRPWVQALVLPLPGSRAGLDPGPDSEETEVGP